MVRGAIRATKQPMVVWVYDLDIEAFKESLDVSKEFCNRIDEDGKTLDRGFNFHMYRGQHFALSPSMQAVEINKETIFVGGQGIYWIKISMWGNKKLAILAYPEDGTYPTTKLVSEAPLSYDQEIPTSDIAGAEIFNKGGIPSTLSFANIQEM